MRQPENVHIYLYRRTREGPYEYAIFQRSDNPAYWQGISGGVEEGETAEQAARREALEEAGITDAAPLYRLDTVSYLPANLFAEAERWGKNVVVCPMYSFAMPYNGDIALSDEHLAMRWLAFEQAHALVYWHDQKTALWELDQRLKRGNLARTEQK